MAGEQCPVPCPPFLPGLLARWTADLAQIFGADQVGTFETNALGTRRMLGVAKGTESEGFLFLSSGEVCGRQLDPSMPISEKSFGPLGPY